MKRNKKIERSDQDKLLEHKHCIAFHEAGYAAAIYLNNKAQNLPPVFFQITLMDLSSNSEQELMDCHNNCIASVEGGLFIEMLAPTLESSVNRTTDDNDSAMHFSKDYMVAFEADVINQLIGSLAEAKHVADFDDEPFSRRLINLNALEHYGGNADLALAIDYVQLFSTCKQQQEEKLQELFSVAFNFINDSANWLAITRLANYILNSNKDIISSGEVAALVDEVIAPSELQCKDNDKSAAILFVDDDVIVLKALRRLFLSENYVTYFASSGSEGLEILQQNAVDLVISDMSMPGMNGAEFLAQVVKRWPETTRILLTGYVDLQSTIEAVNKGRIFHYCNKPWNNQELKLLVRNVLEEKTTVPRKR